MEIVRRWNYGLLQGRTLKAGQIRRPLGDIDHDHDLIGRNRQTESEDLTFDENIDISASYRVGPVYAEGASSACTSYPTYRHSTIVC